jgi:prepilin-type N-terminal cleavage/methylation domain-containing protein
VNSQKGFTLLEILVVLTIMGFLIAMVAPRLASVGESASETVCNSNKSRYRVYVSAFYNQNDGKYPSGLTNMVITDGSSANAYVAPASDEDPDTGKEVLAKGHNMMYKFMPHTLNSAEAAELESLGIDKVFNLNDYTGLNTSGWGNITNFNKQSGASNRYPDTIATGDQNSYMEEAAVEAGAHVVMAGCGAIAQTGNFDGPYSVPRLESKWAYKDLFARIIFSIGAESELVTSGIISNAAHCPGSIIRSDNFTYGEYYLILPRLNATIKRFEDGASFNNGHGINMNATALETVKAIGCPKDNQATNGYNVGGNTSNYQADTVNLIAEQEPWEFRTSRNRDDTVWFFDFNGGGTLQVPGS